MKNAQKPDHISLWNLINRLRDGQYEIPDFQREFEWEPWDIRELMRSIFLDYYIGSLLLWRGSAANFADLACEPIYGFSGNRKPFHIVLDGQQRLTAMYYAFVAPNVPAPKRRNRFIYFLKVDNFMEEVYDDAFYYEWTRTGENLLDNQDKQFDEHIFPLAVVGQDGWALPNWVQGYTNYWKSKREDEENSESPNEVNLQSFKQYEKNAVEFGKYLQNLTQQYQISFIELDQDLELDKICDIFTQINSRGIRLDAFDLLNAMLKPKGLQLKHLWREAKPTLEFVETDRMNVYVLQVMSIQLQAYCSPKYLYYLLPGQPKQVRGPDGSLQKEVLIPDATKFEQRWREAVSALEHSITLLRHPQEFGAISSQYLPYASILPAFAAVNSLAKKLPAERQLEAQRKLRNWYWASVFTNRYSGSVESTSARDFVDMRNWFGSDNSEPEVIGEFNERITTLELRRETRKGTSVYNAVFNLIVLQGARDWTAGTVFQQGDLDDHHIVPKSWGRSRELGESIDTILNRAPLTAETNRNVIREQLPNAYLPELICQNGESMVRETLASHLVSPVAFDILLRTPFSRDDFEEFIAERERTIRDAIRGIAGVTMG